MKGKQLLKLLCILLMLLFIGSYLIEMSGYYEYNLQSKRNLTTEQMEQFEKDIKEGKNIDLNQYLEQTKVDYSNKLTRSTSEISLKMNDYLKKILTNGFHIFEKFIK